MADDAPKPEKRRPNESWESYSERKIREAQSEGAFDNLAGFGRPLAGMDQPWTDNSWIREKLKREGLSVLPPILEMRLKIEKTLEKLPSICSEYVVRNLLAALNQQIERAHFSHIAGPADGVRPVNIEATVAEWKTARNITADSTGNSAASDGDHGCT